jgi:hypothetical protein
MPPQEPTTIAHAAPGPDLADAPSERWLEDDEQLPPRPRRRLLTPLPLALAAVLLIACGFIGGVLVEKGQNETSSATPSGGASAFASRLRSLAGAAGSGSSSSAGAGAGAGGAGAGGGFARPTAGTVAYISGDTLYVTGTESNTIKVWTSPGTSVTKTVQSSVKAIHPGETVTVTGSTAADGIVTAESIRVGSLGGGLASLLGGGTSSSSSSGSGSGASSSGSSGEPALFGK